MDIIGALKQEQSKLQAQLTAIHGAIAALNGSSKTVVSRGHVGSSSGTSVKRIMSAAARAKISGATKARWARFRAEKAKGKKAK